MQDIARKRFGLVAAGLYGLVSGCGAVTVANTPLLVRDADHPARHTFQSSCTASRMTPGELDCAFPATVPSGHLLVIETVTANVSFSTGKRAATMALETQTSGLVAEHALVPIPVATGISTFPLGTVDTFAISEPVRLYADGGSTVTIKAVPAGSPPASAIYATISGYTVDCGVGSGCPLP